MRTLILPGIALAFTLYCLFDALRSSESDIRALPRIAWIVLVLLVPVLGSVAWLVAGRPRGTRPPGGSGRRRPQPPVVGPDDDPDFLRGIERPRPVERPDPVDPDDSDR